MNQFACSHCGYDMTGIERFSNSMDMCLYSGLSSFIPMELTSLYNSSYSSVACPNCGKVGTFIKH